MFLKGTSIEVIIVSILCAGSKDLDLIVYENK